MHDSPWASPPFGNEETLHFAPGSPERERIRRALAEASPLEFGPIVGGREIRTGETVEIRRPDSRGTLLGLCHLAGEAEVSRAIEAALEARRGWAAWPQEERAAVFRRAAELVAGKYRYRLLAATMLGQGKTVQQAEIDAIGETADFLRLNPLFAAELAAWQPRSGRSEWNRLVARPLEGFVLAVSPFNFTAIAANLATAPALMGNVVLWKPATTSLLSNRLLMEIYAEAGLPPGVINFLPGQGSLVAGRALAHRDFAGLHFTGSTGVFNSLWRAIAAGLEGYRSYPRVVGETGGKGFVFLDPSADRQAALTALVRGAFEYQGQKCSAASRLYLPSSLGRGFLDELAAELRKIPMGRVDDLSTFLGPVIDGAAHGRIMGALGRARSSKEARILAGGGGDDSEGYFIEPSLVEVSDPHGETMETELFGPVLSAYIYDEGDMEAAYRLVDGTSPYGLTGAVFARDRAAALRAMDALGDAAGNLYLNDKPTGAVVGRQPFGGSRGSGTNDKAGSPFNLLRWTSLQTRKENADPPLDWRHPSMAPD